MNVKHTPGPWTIQVEEPDRKWVLIMHGGPAGQIVANVNTESCPDVTSVPAFRVMPAEANAHLIAAAPELLEALEALEGMLEAYSATPFGQVGCHFANECDKARATIAKAKGQP